MVLTPRKLTLIGVVIGVVVIAVVSAVYFTSSGEKDDRVTAAGSASSGSELLTGDRDDWFNAVCRSGSVQNGSGDIFPNATGQAICQGKSGALGIGIGQWESQFMMQNDLNMVQYPVYATGHSDTGYIAFAVFSFAKSKNGLEPLEQFGFKLLTK